MSSPDIRPGTEVRSPSDQVRELLSREIPNGSGLRLTVICGFTDVPDSYAVYSTSDYTRSIEVTDENGAIEKGDFYDSLRRYGAVHELFTFNMTREAFVAAAIAGISVRPEESVIDGQRANTQSLLNTLNEITS